MAIPESQLETWARQGSIDQSKDTYATVRRCLMAHDTAFASKQFEVFLQGSYGNDTNIYSESDVDVVIRLDSTYHYDARNLTAGDLAAFNARFSPATYSYSEFKLDVLSALQKSFESAVTVGKKAITIAPAGNRRKLDVLVATQFRNYGNFAQFPQEQFEEGICFWTSGGERIVNYPRQHSENCTRKHQATSSWFKPTVRILKNMRQCMVKNGKIPPSLAPSYFLEGLLYNVPNSLFNGSYESMMAAAFDWALEADPSQFICANEQYYLLRDVPHVCWPGADCVRFLSAAKDFWNGWSEP